MPLRPGGPPDVITGLSSATLMKKTPSRWPRLNAVEEGCGTLYAQTQNKYVLSILVGTRMIFFQNL